MTSTPESYDELCRRLWGPSFDEPAAPPTAENVSTFPLEPSIEQAERFLKLLDPSTDRFTFQTFDDVELIEGDKVKKRQQGDLARIFHGTLAEHAEELKRLNSLGAGVYITVNATNLQGRTTADMVRVRDVWREDDDGMRAQKPLPLQPHVVVESSAGKFHEHLFVQGMSFDQHRDAIEAMVTRYGSCEGAKGLNRVLRLPGYYHMKGSPFLVKIVGGSALASGWMPYPANVVCTAFPVPAPRPETASQTHAEDVNITHVAEALRYVTDYDNRQTWLRVGQALHDADSDEARELWDTWSQQSGKYDPDDQQRVWDSFNHGRDRRVTIGSIFRLARKGGWVPPADFRGDPTSGFTGDEEAKAEAEADDGFYYPKLSRDPATIPPRPWLFKNDILRRTTTVYVSPPGVAKSILSLGIAIAAARGDGAFLGMSFVGEPCRVLIINNEDEADELEMRIAAMCKLHGFNQAELEGRIAFYGKKNSETFVACARDERGELAKTLAFKKLEAFVTREKTGAIVLDPFRSIHTGNENDSGDVSIVVGALMEMASRTNCAPIVIHHTRKPAGSSSDGIAGDPDMARGSGDLTGKSRKTFTLAKMTKDEAEDYGIEPEDRWRYVRLDDGKLNRAGKQGVRWYNLKGMEIGNGETAVALGLIDLEPVEKPKQVSKLERVLRQALHAVVAAGGRLPHPDNEHGLAAPLEAVREQFMRLYTDAEEDAKRQAWGRRDKITVFKSAKINGIDALCSILRPESDICDM